LSNDEGLHLFSFVLKEKKKKKPNSVHSNKKKRKGGLSHKNLALSEKVPARTHQIAAQNLKVE
jgi:hypothetical protein